METRLYIPSDYSKPELRIKILFGTMQGIFTLALEQEERMTGHIYEAFVMLTQLVVLIFFCYSDETGKHFHAQDLSAKCQCLQKGLGVTAK